MVTAEHVETRLELAEAMGHLTATAAILPRRGHEGKHKSCDECRRLVMLHDRMDFHLTSYQDAEG